jgi:hypothetical protein
VYYILIYEVVGDHVTRRAPYREEHLRLLNEAHERGELVMAGALRSRSTERCSSFAPTMPPSQDVSPSAIRMFAMAWSRDEGAGLERGGRRAILRHGLTDRPLEEVHGSSLELSEEFYKAVQFDCAEWIKIGTTKTAMVYGLGNVPVKNHE